jgi:predicted dehydrogenase
MHRSLVIGLGSAGTRHRSKLREIGSTVSSLSRREEPKLYSSLLSNEFRSLDYDLIVVATETSTHQAVVNGIYAANFAGTILVEKPGLVQLPDLKRPEGSKTLVAYNLRYLDVLNRVKRLIDSAGNPLRVSISATSYLPSWRVETTPRETYSEYAALGGGALFDLSHELDYSQWLFGTWKEVKAIGGRVGAVTKDADDSWKIIGSTEKCQQISIDLSLVSHLRRRECLIEFSNFAANVDLLAGRIEFSDRPPVFGDNIDSTYYKMLEDLVLRENTLLPTVSENRNTLNFIDQLRAKSVAKR